MAQKPLKYENIPQEKRDLVAPYFHHLRSKITMGEGVPVEDRIEMVRQMRMGGISVREMSAITGYSERVVRYWSSKIFKGDIPQISIIKKELEKLRPMLGETVKQCKKLLKLMDAPNYEWDFQEVKKELERSGILTEAFFRHNFYLTDQVFTTEKRTDNEYWKTKKRKALRKIQEDSLETSSGLMIRDSAELPESGVINTETIRTPPHLQKDEESQFSWTAAHETHGSKDA